jgi:hypothetical protein
MHMQVGQTRKERRQSEGQLPEELAQRRYTSEVCLSRLVLTSSLLLSRREFRPGSIDGTSYLGNAARAVLKRHFMRENALKPSMLYTFAA